MFTLPRGPQPAPDRRFGAPELLRPLHDRVWWATTETATDFAGHLEGAVRAGIAAARSVEHAAISCGPLEADGSAVGVAHTGSPQPLSRGRRCGPVTATVSVE